MKKLLLACILFLSMAGYLHATEYTLQDLYGIALGRSERIRISEEDVVISERVKDKALSYLFPRISGTGSYTGYHDRKVSDANTLLQPYESTVWSLRLDQSMSTSGRELVGLRIAKSSVNKSRQDLFSAKESHLLSVAYAYYDLLRAGKLVEISKQNIERLTKYKDAASTRLRLGEITKTALLRAEAELSGAQSDLVKTQNLVKSAKAALQRAVGLDEEFDIYDMYRSGLTGLTKAGEIQGGPDISGCIPVEVECLKEKAYRERSELKAYEIQKGIAEAQVSYARGAHWPTLSIEGGYVGRHESPETMGLVRDNIYGALRLNLPLFEGGLRQAEIQEAMARKRQAEYALADVKKSVALDVENAYLDYVTQKGILKSLGDQFTFAEDNYRAVSKQFDFGLAQSIDVVDANTVLVSAQTQLTQALYNYQQSTVRLQRVAGALLRSAEQGSASDQKAK